jgi:hypothetical protein
VPIERPRAPRGLRSRPSPRCSRGWLFSHPHLNLALVVYSVNSGSRLPLRRRRGSMKHGERRPTTR